MGLKDFIFNHLSSVKAINGSIGIHDGQVVIRQTGFLGRERRTVTVPPSEVRVSRRFSTLIIHTAEGETFKLRFWDDDDAWRAQTHINVWGKWFY